MHDLVSAGEDAALPILIVGDDQLQFDALDTRLRGEGVEVRRYRSISVLRNAIDPQETGCVVLDVSLSDIAKIQVQRQRAPQGCDVPMVFVTEEMDYRTTIAAMKAGAIDCLSKPFRPQDLLAAVRSALTIGYDRHRRRSAERELRQRYSTLSEREREVLKHISRGLFNKQIAHAIGMSEITVKLDRSNIMRALGQTTHAGLVSYALALEALLLRDRRPSR